MTFIFKVPTRTKHSSKDAESMQVTLHQIEVCITCYYRAPQPVSYWTNSWKLCIQIESVPVDRLYKVTTPFIHIYTERHSDFSTKTILHCATMTNECIWKQTIPSHTVLITCKFLLLSSPNLFNTRYKKEEPKQWQSGKLSYSRTYTRHQC